MAGMNEIDANEIINILSQRIARLEVENAMKEAYIKQFSQQNESFTEGDE